MSFMHGDCASCLQLAKFYIGTLEEVAVYTSMLFVCLLLERQGCFAVIEAVLWMGLYPRF